MLQDMMEDQKIEIMAAHKIVAVTDEGAVVEPTDGGERMTIPADKVVLSIGLKTESVYGAGFGWQRR